MGNSTRKEAHGRTLFRNREVLPARNKSRREVEGVSGTESEDRDDVDIIENSGGDVEKAAEAERRIIEEMRQMGNEVLHGWARRQQQKKEEEYTAKAGVNRKEKKRFTGTPESGKSKL